MARLFGRGAAGNRSNQDGSLATFTSGVSGDITSPATLLANYKDIYELGQPGVQVSEAVAGNASATFTVPTGKYWQLVGVYHTLVTDGTAANRAVVIAARDSANDAIETITHANVTASTTAKRTTLFGTDDYVVGNEAVSAQGTLTVAADVTEDDTIVINGTTFTFKDALTGAANEILTGADHDATQASLEAAFVDRDNGGTLHTVTDSVYEALGCTFAAFATDDMVITASVKGTAGNSIGTTETFTSGSNVFDATTLGTTTAGVDAADKLATIDYPTTGVLLEPAEDVNVSVTNGVAGDALDVYLFYLEFDADPNP